MAQAAHGHASGMLTVGRIEMPHQEQRSSPASSQRPRPVLARKQAGAVVQHSSASRPVVAHALAASSRSRPAGMSTTAPAAHGAVAGGSCGRASARRWQHQEPEPVGRALQIPTPIAPNRGQPEGSNGPQLQGESSTHAATVFQHPQRATLMAGALN
jgi:hypothetical protein